MTEVTAIEFVEVGPRDGLQNEARLVTTEQKLELIGRAIEAGVRRIETTSFVNPKRVPQMADADAVAAGLPDRDDVTYIGLVLNARGAERAITTTRIDQLGAVAIATDRFGIANQGQSSSESVEAAIAIVDMARGAGLSGQVTIAAAFGCPFEGEVAEDQVVRMAARLATTSRPITPLEIPPMTWSVTSCQTLPIVAAGGSLLRSSIVAGAESIFPSLLFVNACQRQVDIALHPT